MPQITLPTRLSDTCDTLIDNTLTNYYENTHTSGVLSMPISDHQMTFTSLVGTTLQATNKQLIEFEKVNNRAIENFKADLASCNIYAYAGPFFPIYFTVRSYIKLPRMI